MVRASILLLCAALVPAQDDERGASGDPSDAGLAFVELELGTSTAVVGQAVRLTLRFGVERDFLQQRLVQPFRQPLDLPVQLRTGDLGSLSGARLDPAPAPGDGPSFVWDGALTRGRALAGHRREGREYVAAELVCTLVPTRPGRLVLPAPRLEFAHASGFREDVVHGRIAIDRRDAFVRGQPATVEVRDPPEEGQPLGFAGAVGRFEVWARVDRRLLELGEGLALTLEIDGAGDLGQALSSWPARVEGFRVRGRSDDGTGRRVVLDLTPLDADVDEVPALGLPYYDPSAGAYRTAESEPIPIDVRPRSGQSVTPPSAPPTRQVPDPTFDPRWIGAGVLLAALVGLAAWRARRRPGSDPRGPLVAAAATRARERLRAQEEPREVLVAVLAAVLDCAPPGVLGPRLAQRLTAAGLSPELAQAADQRLQEWDRARFGGTSGAGDPAAARALIDRIEGETTRAGRSGP